jgi:predicted transcriptional regulator
MTLYEKHEARLRALLEHLSAKGAQRHVDLMRVWIQRDGTLASFTSAVTWLKMKGYVQKKGGGDKTSPYEITEQGKKYLEGIKA